MSVVKSLRRPEPDHQLPVEAARVALQAVLRHDLRAVDLVHRPVEGHLRVLPRAPRQRLAVRVRPINGLASPNNSHGIPQVMYPLVTSAS
jgi:hypothetical protein